MASLRIKIKKMTKEELSKYYEIVGTKFIKPSDLTDEQIESALQICHKKDLTKWERLKDGSILVKTKNGCQVVTYL